MGNKFCDFIKYWKKLFKIFFNRNMNILISNLLSESILMYQLKKKENSLLKKMYAYENYLHTWKVRKGKKNTSLD